MTNVLSSSEIPFEIVFDTFQERRTLRVLRDITRNQEFTARFLNSLSLLEHIGSRMIMRSAALGLGGPSPLLMHLAEETRHAWFLRRSAETLIPRSMSYEPADLLGQGHLRSYMNRLHAHIIRMVGIQAAYYFMSYTVEVRAVWLYGLCQQIFRECGSKLNLGPLLAEEEKHLADLRRSINCHQSAIRQCVFHEHRLFEKLLGNVEASLHCGP